jgi:hypothetical protein
MTAKIWKFTIEVETTTKRDAVAELARLTSGGRVAGIRTKASPIYSSRKYRKRKEES